MTLVCLESSIVMSNEISPEDTSILETLLPQFNSDLYNELDRGQVFDQEEFLIDEKRFQKLDKNIPSVKLNSFIKESYSDLPNTMSYRFEIAGPSVEVEHFDHPCWEDRSGAACPDLPYREAVYERILCLGGVWIKRDAKGSLIGSDYHGVKCYIQSEESYY